MPIKAKQNGSYKDVTDLMNVDESIDYVLAKTSSSYKRVYTATRSIEDVPPTTFKSIKSGANLSNYRIYGNTSKNILPLSKTPKTETIGDILCEYDGKGTFTFTSNVDNPSYPSYFSVDLLENYVPPIAIGRTGGTGCIQLNNTGHGDSEHPRMNFVLWNADEMDELIDIDITSDYIVSTDYEKEPDSPETATSVAFLNMDKMGKGSITFKVAMFEGVSTQQPFEPCGESVGNRTGNLFTTENELENYYVASNGIVAYTQNYNTTDFLSVDPNTAYSYSFINSYTETDRYCCIAFYNTNKEFISCNDHRDTYPIGKVTVPFTTTSNTFYVRISYLTIIFDENMMLNTGSTPLPYEPYGYKVPVTVEGKNLLSPNIEWFRNNLDDPSNYLDTSSSRIKTDLISVNDNNTLKISGLPSGIYLVTYRYYLDSTSTGQMGNNSTGVIPLGAKYVSVLLGGTGFNNETKTLLQNSPIQLEYGSTATPYEPYQTPVTTPIYLPEQIRKVGSEAEYIDYGEQKQHRVRKNLFDELYPNINNNRVTYKAIYVGDGIFTLSCDIPIVSGTTANLFLLSGNVSSGASSTKNGVGYGVPQSAESIDGYVTIGYRNFGDVDPRDYNTMLNAGTSALPYEPYIENTEVDVTLPALPTLAGTNILSVGTEVQPSKIDITGHIKTISGGS